MQILNKGAQFLFVRWTHLKKTKHQPWARPARPAKLRSIEAGQDSGAEHWAKRRSKFKSQQIDQVQHLIFFSTQDFSQDFCKYQKSIRRKVLFNNLTKPTKPECETLKRKRLWKESGDDSNFGRSLAWNLGKFTSLGDSFRRVISKSFSKWSA